MYEIIVNRIETVQETERGKWVVVEKRPYTDKEVSEANRYWQETDHRADLKEVMGYTPDVTVTRETTRQVYRQELAECDLTAIIQAANGKPRIVYDDEGAQ